LLAQYITVYNAVYRGNWDYFAGRYKTPVLNNINPRQNVGISVRFDEWPGRTLMVIPLGIGGISSIDTSTISDGRVVDEMRQADDRGIPERQDMVDLKEREADAAEQRAADQRAQADRDQQAVADQRAQAERDRQQAERDRASGTITQEEADRRQAEADQRTDDLDRRQEEIDRQREDAGRQEQFAEQRNEEAQRDRESIAADQQGLIDQGTPRGGIIAVAIEPRDSTLGRIVTLDPATGRELRRSPLNTVYARTITFTGGKVLAIAGENRGNAAVRLIEVNSSTLEMVKQGSDDIHPNSLIWMNGSDLYAITVNTANGTLSLGRFNTDLVLQAKSVVAVHPNASVNVQQGALLTQKTDGGAVLLNPRDLTERSSGDK
jgi:multidrug efflux pump subunit AcrA (membrane-fusion protein)